VPEFVAPEEEKIDKSAFPINMSEMKTASRILGKKHPVVEHIQVDIAENSLNEEWKHHLKAQIEASMCPKLNLSAHKILKLTDFYMPLVPGIQTGKMTPGKEASSYIWRHV